MGSLTEISIFDSDEEDNSNQTDLLLSYIWMQICVVCFWAREATWNFMPCKHVNCCEDCSTRIEEIWEACPTRRSVIQNSFEIFSNWNNQQNYLSFIVNHISYSIMVIVRFKIIIKINICCRICYIGQKV